jgi:hypothetical protein
MAGPPSAAPNAGQGAPPRMVRRRTAVIASVVSLLVGVGIGAAGQSPAATSNPTPSAFAAASQVPVESAGTSEPSAEPTPEPTPVVTPQPTVATAKAVIVRGSGSQKTKPFTLPDGDFTVVITGSGDGNVIVRLIPRGGTSLDAETLFNEISNGKYTYDTVVYGVTAGSYYLDATVDGRWVVTFTPLP